MRAKLRATVSAGVAVEVRWACNNSATVSVNFVPTEERSSLAEDKPAIGIETRMIRQRKRRGWPFTPVGAEHPADKGCELARFPCQEDAGAVLSCLESHIMNQLDAIEAWSGRFPVSEPVSARIVGAGPGDAGLATPKTLAELEVAQ